MLSRTTALAALGIAALISGGTTAGTVLTQSVGNETGLATSAAHRAAAAEQHTDTTSASPNESTVELPPCPADVKNHGEYVSSVAGDKTHDGDTNHGALVSAAAQSDCGKPAGAGADADAAESETESSDTGETHGQSANPHGKAGQSHGKSGEHVPSQAPVGS